MALASKIFTTTAPYGSYGGRYMTLKIEETSIDTINNRSTLKWTLTSLGGEYNFYSTGSTTVTINGTQVYYKERVEYDTPSTTPFPAAKGSVSGTLTVTHDTSGEKTITVVFSTAIYYGSQYVTNYGGTMSLSKIDKAAPTLSASISKITSNSFYITATANSNCYSWDYSIDNGATWTNYSSRDTTSTTKTVTGLTPNTTYNVKIRARKTSNHVLGTMSTAVSAKTLGGTKLNSVQAFSADGDTAQIVINATVYNAAYTHTLTVKNGNTTILTISNITYTATGTANKSITLTSAQKTALLNAMSSAKSITATYVLKTYSGSTQIGTDSSVTGTINTTESISKPEFTAFTFADVYETTTALTEDDQILIQDKSLLQVVCTAATAKNGATIAKYTANIGSVTKESSTTTISYGAVKSSGDLLLTVTAVDSRGYTASVSTTVSVIPYEAPSINDWSIRRINDVEDTTHLDFNGSYSTITINGTAKNTITAATYSYKERGSGQPWSDAATISGVTISGGSITYDSDAFASFDDDKSFNIKVILTDELSTSDLLLTLDVGRPLMTFRARKVGILQNNPQRELDVEGIIGMNGYNVMGYCGEATNLNSLFEPGYYKVTSSTTGRPPNKTGFVEVFPKHGIYSVQRMISVDNVTADIYVRRITSSAQGSWYHLTATEVT